MFYNWSKNPEKPEWIAVHSLSRIEGGHKYSADPGGTIVACCLGDAIIKALGRNAGKPAVCLDDAFDQECKKQA